MPITTCALADDIKTIGAINSAVRSRTFSPLIWSLPPTVAAAPRFFLGYGGVPFSLIPDFRLKIALSTIDEDCRWKGAQLRIVSQFELLPHLLSPVAPSLGQGALSCGETPKLGLLKFRCEGAGLAG